MLALIAGQGALPGMLYAHLAAAGSAPVVAEFKGSPAHLPGDAPIQFSFETIGTLMREFQSRGVDDVCVAGAIGRTELDARAVDAATQPLVPVIAAALRDGDNGALRVGLRIIEDAGFRVRAAQDIMPALTPPPGILGKHAPSDRDRADAERAAAICAAMGAADAGQACVVAAGQVVAIEALGGTDWMLQSISGGRRPAGPGGGILFKAPKPDQDRRVDMPVIGPETVQRAARSGLAGVVVEAQGVLVLGLDATRAAANAKGLFVWVRKAS
jgi:DUF1009 family protein